MSAYALAEIPFDAAAAEGLASDFDSMADLLESQNTSRNSLASTPRGSWEGALSGEFDERLSICTSDGQDLADAMRVAAQGVRELAEMVAEENRRREHARAYEQEQADKNWFVRAGNNVKDFFTGRDPLPAPPPPLTPPNPEVLVTVDPRDL